MTVNKAQTWGHLASFLPEDDILKRARFRAAELGYSVITAATGSMLSTLAASHKAQHILEVGTGTGVSGIYLLRGASSMNKNTMLTTIDSSTDRTTAAKTAFKEAGFAANQIRSIDGDSRRVLPRMAEDAYDMVYIRTSAYNFSDFFIEAHRILKPGGVIVISDVLQKPRTQDYIDDTSPEQNFVAEFVSDVLNNPHLASTITPTENGMLISVKKS